MSFLLIRVVKKVDSPRPQFRTCVQLRVLHGLRSEKVNGGGFSGYSIYSNRGKTCTSLTPTISNSVNGLQCVVYPSS